MEPINYTSIQKVLQYQTSDGQIPFRKWFLSLKDVQVQARIRTRLDRLIQGNLGDSKNLGSGIYELRLHFGPGYRIYFGRESETTVVLLWGGEKSRQEKDLSRAREYWKDYLRRRP